jgi:PAS domain S-box-containing protein
VWTDAEIDLLTTVVTRCWESVQRVHALDALRENEERYRLLVERATDGIWLVDEHGRYLDVNPAACEMLGYTRAEHLALRIADVVSPDELPRLTAQLQAMHDGQSLTEVWEVRHRDGRWVPLELSMRSAGHGRLQAVGRDVTARRRCGASGRSCWSGSGRPTTGCGCCRTPRRRCRRPRPRSRSAPS